MSGTHQLLVIADCVYLFRENKNTIKKNKESLVDASREVGPDVNT
jgi:hypothetical protein